MKIIKYILILFLYFKYTFLFSQFCDNNNVCTNERNQYPNGVYTPTSNWGVISQYMNGGNWTLFNVEQGSTYEWSYCSDFGGFQNWNAELTLFSYPSNSFLCYQNNSGRVNCPNAPYLSWTATFTGVVKLLTNVATTINCQTNSNSPFSGLVCRRINTSTSCTHATNPSSDYNISYTGSSNRLVYAQGICGANIFTSDSWINIQDINGNQIYYSIDFNSQNTSRSGYIRFQYTDGTNGYFYISQQANPNNSNCVTFYNGTPNDQEFLTATNFLCDYDIVPSSFNSSNLGNSIALKDISLACYNALYPNNDAFVSNFPHPFLDIDNVPGDVRYKNALLTMLYLEYPIGNETDGIAPLSRDYFNVRPEAGMFCGKALKLFCEAFNIQPDYTDYYEGNNNSTNFINSISYNDPYYGYYRALFYRGLLPTDVIINNTGLHPNSYLTYRDAYIILYKILYYTDDNIHNDNNYFTPNSFSATSNLGSSGEIDRGIFAHYEDPSFSIPGGGLPLEFTHSYHSNLTETPRYLYDDGYVDSIIYIQRFNPLGVGWTHNYNIFLQVATPSDYSSTKYILWWDDGSADVFNYTNWNWETKNGRYLTFASTSYLGNQAFSVTTKDKIVYTFIKDPNYWQIYNLVEIKDRNNNTITLQYENGHNFGNLPTPKRLKTVTDNVSGRSLNFSYSPYGSNYIESVSDNTGRTIRFSVDIFTKDLFQFRDANGGVFKYYYGSRPYNCHLLESIMKPKGNVITNTYLKRKLKQTNSSDYIINVDFNTPYSGGYFTNSTITETRNGQTLTTDIKHNINGLPVTITSNTQNISYQYNTPNQPLLPSKITNNNTGIYTEYFYDNNGNVSQINKRNNLNQIQTHYFGFNTTFNTLTSYTNPRGKTTNFTLDSKGNTSRINYPDNTYVEFYRNSNGNIYSIRHQDGKYSNIGYNSYGNPDQFGYSGSSIIHRASYDALSRIRTLTDPNGYINQYTYSNNDQLKEVINDINGQYEKTSYEYDENDNLLKITDAKNQSTFLTYDYNTDDLTDECYGGFCKKWLYNTDGTVSNFKNKNNFWFNYQYYPKGDNRESLLKNDGYATYNYNTLTKALNTVTHNLNGYEIAFTYDGFQRIERVYYNDFTGNVVQYKYDANDNITEILYPFGYKVLYTYDNLDRLIQIVDGSGYQLAYYRYYPDGRLDEQQHGDATVTKYLYDSNNRVDSIVHYYGNTIISAYGFSLDNNGNHLEERIYEPYNSGEFQSLPVANNYASNYDYDNTNRLTSTNFNNWYHNNNGAHTVHGIFNYRYDEKDNMTNAWDNNGQYQSIVNEYDGLENRRLKNNTRYVLDLLNNSNVLVEVDINTNQPIAVYYHGLGLICRYDVARAQYYYYHYDFRGSTTMILDRNRTITHTYRYGTFGDVTNQTQQFEQPFKYVGKYGVQYDLQNLYYMRNRCYNPYYGKFYSEDPLWSTNLFPYADNNPINKIDPNGKFAETPWDAANAAMDAASLAKNLSTGNYGGAIVDGAGLLLDVIASAVPGAPGGAGTVINSARVAKKLKNTSRVVSNLIPDGFKVTKKFGYSYGQKIYKYKGKYYSRDITSHNGGVWKVFEEKGGKLRRIGTADENLIIFKK